ncbi:MAG TPA: sigma 54-interacting transcriptional regulator [Candidatus Deferrimicrobiaceae bacterium]
MKCMSLRDPLDPDDWRFLEMVAQAAFANPFGQARDDLDVRIGGADPGATPGAVLDAAIARVGERIGRLQRAGCADVRGYGRTRGETIRTAVLFHLFHRHADAFDALIRAQSGKGDAPVAAPFAGEAMRELSGFGFDPEEAGRHLALFYQMRRAFHFVRDGLVGSSPAMRKLRERLWNCVFTHDIRWFESGLRDRMTEFPVLLLGETGTGKGAAASAIGRSGFIPFDAARGRFAESFTRNFVAINLSQYAESVLESELFGHRKGAFTGAIESHEGLFGRCQPNGVIFLDEIGDAAVPVQIKLLHVLQDRTYFPVGSHETCRFEGRIVAATNRPMGDLMREGRFREDLYYRLCSDEITLPTLRQRLREDPGELGRLVSSILSRLDPAASGREERLVMAALRDGISPDYPWPGNVRELEQAVKRVILTGRYEGREAVPSAGTEDDALLAGVRDAALDAGTLLARYCAMLHRRFGSYEEVARKTGLDRRTVRKYILSLDTPSRL